MSSLLSSLPGVRGAKELNRELFKVDIKVPYIQIKTSDVAKVMPVLKKYILKLPKFKPVQTENNQTKAYFDPEKTEKISENDRKFLLSHGEYLPNGEITLNYENFTAPEILKAILPEGMEIPSSFSRVGHIIHMNLRDFQEPFGQIIGQVYLDKIANVTTVVNKTSNIDTTYRFFSMEVLAGEPKTVVTVKENKFNYTFDFAKVYWNPRLSTEHQALTDLLKPGDVLYDVFAGVGPFAIPAARKNVTVLANDLNPESFNWLEKNATANKAKNIQFFNLDGREFIKTEVKKHLIERRKNGEVKNEEHVVMNLPALAAEFLDVFRDWLTLEEEEMVYEKAVNVHVYCFVKLQENEEAVAKAKSLVEKHLGCELGGDRLTNIHFVRNVAPNKEMMRVSFLLMRKVVENGEEPARKRVKVDCNDGHFVGRDGTQAGSEEIEKCVQAERSPNHEGEEGAKS